MKSIRSFSFWAVLAAGLICPLVATAHDDHKSDKANEPAGQLVAVTEKDAGWVAKQKAEHPTSMCIVSDEKLGGEMGEPVDYIYRVAGKPDRLITFCCKNCVKDFTKDPEKYLALLDRRTEKTDEPAKHAH
jgi:hypothetical protein